MIATKHTGWIGVDIGTSTVKVAQVVRSQNRLRLAATAIIPRQAIWPTEHLSDHAAISSADQIRTALSLHSNFRGRRTAATLPMALCDVLVLDRTLDAEPQKKQIIQHAIETATQHSAENLQFDSWTVEEPQKDGSLGRTNILTTPKTWTDQLCEDIEKTGGSCQSIDGLPLALARAVDMVHQDHREAPVAALDWGFGRATFCLIVDRQPVYVRCLKECGFQQVLNAITDHLHVTQNEAQQLLEEHGLPDTSNGKTSNASQVVDQLIAEPLAQMEEELQRTLSHLQIQRWTTIPSTIYLLGGGATLRGIIPHLTARLSTPVRIWELEHSVGVETPDDLPPASFFGPAAALSALAWEKS